MSNRRIEVQAALSYLGPGWTWVEPDLARGGSKLTFEKDGTDQSVSFQPSDVRKCLDHLGPGWAVEHLTTSRFVFRSTRTGEYREFRPSAELYPWNGHELDVLLAQVRDDQALFLPDLHDALGVSEEHHAGDALASALRWRGWRQNRTNRPEWWFAVRADVFWKLQPPNSIESFAFFGPICRGMFGPGTGEQGELAPRSIKVMSDEGGTYRRKVVEVPASRVLLLRTG